MSNKIVFSVLAVSVVLLSFLFYIWWSVFHIPDQDLYRTHFRRLEEVGAVKRFTRKLDFRGNQRVYIIELYDSSHLSEIDVYGYPIASLDVVTKDYIARELKYLSGTGITLPFGQISRCSEYEKDIGNYALFGIWLYSKKGGAVGIFGTQP